MRDSSALQITNDLHHLRTVVTQDGSLLLQEVFPLVDQVHQVQQSTPSAPLKQQVQVFLRGKRGGGLGCAVVEQGYDAGVAQRAEEGQLAGVLESQPGYFGGGADQKSGLHGIELASL